MASFRVTIVCFWNGSIRESSGNVDYVGGRRKLFACKSNMDLNDFKRLISSRIGLDPTTFTVDISFKYFMSEQFTALSVEDEYALDAMWEHSKISHSLEIYAEVVPLGKVVASNPNPTPTPMPISTQDPFDPSPSCTPSQPPPNQVSNDEVVNLGESEEGTPWADGFESNEIDDDPSEDDVDVDEDALATDMTLGNIPTIVPPTPYAKCPPVDEHEEDNSWRTWACDTTYTEEGELEKGMMFDNKKALLEAIKLYHIRRNVEYRTETSNQSVLTLKCKRGCSWRLRARIDTYTSSWLIVTYNGKHRSCVQDSDTVSVGHIHLTSSVINNVIRNCVAKDPSIKVTVVRQMVKDRFGIEVNYKRAWCAKQQALLSIYGTWEGSYSVLPHFLKALQHSNPGLVVDWFFKEDNEMGVYRRPNIRTFQRVFWAFKPCIEGFNHCKPLIAIDGTHLYGKYRHTLLTAIAQDGNKGIFPLAFGLVEKECIDAWSWFMACIRKHVTQRCGLCIISDRHAGILATMDEPDWQPPYI
ncbi:unnamed protein product [Amaranthus hypochondriacus]